MAMRSNTQRSLLLSFVGSIVLCAVVGIVCLLTGSFGQLQAKVLLTTGTVATASILGLASASVWERRIWHPIGPLGCTVVAISTVLVMGFIWRTWSRIDEGFVKAVLLSVVWAVAVPHLSLLGTGRLRQAFEWVRWVTVVGVVVLAVQLSTIILFEPHGDLWARWIGVSAIAVACGSIAVPILHRVSAIPLDGAHALPRELSLVCPSCGAQQVVPVGRARCAQCGLGFRIELEAER